MPIKFFAHGKACPVQSGWRGKVLAMWELLAAGRLAEIEAEPWRPGHGPDPRCT